jgi:hypothetical protein
MLSDCPDWIEFAVDETLKWRGWSKLCRIACNDVLRKRIESGEQIHRNAPSVRPYADHDRLFARTFLFAGA